MIKPNRDIWTRKTISSDESVRIHSNFDYSNFKYQIWKTMKVDCDQIRIFRPSLGKIRLSNLVEFEFRDQVQFELQIRHIQSNSELFWVEFEISELRKQKKKNSLQHFF